MKKLLTILVIIVVFVVFYKITSQKPASVNSDYQNSDLILFYGDTCPHCKVVEEFISENQIDQKLKISQLEVYNNQDNSTLFLKMVNENCPENSSSEGLPVPFLVDTQNKECLIGDTPINGYLSEKSK
jgi:glutaredoxin-related protein